MEIIYIQSGINFGLSVSKIVALWSSVLCLGFCLAVIRGCLARKQLDHLRKLNISGSETLKLETKSNKKLSGLKVHYIASDFPIKFSSMHHCTTVQLWELLVWIHLKIFPDLAQLQSQPLITGESHCNPCGVDSKQHLWLTSQSSRIFFVFWTALGKSLWHV